MDQQSFRLTKFWPSELYKIQINGEDLCETTSFSINSTIKGLNYILCTNGMLNVFRCDGSGVLLMLSIIVREKMFVL